VGHLIGGNRADERFRLAVEAAPNAMVMVNHEGKIILVNSQTEMLFGYGREELLWQSVEILVPGSSQPSQRGPLVRPQAWPMGRGHDLHGQRKDGTQFPVELTLSPIETEHGTWVLSVIVDTTDRRQAEAALREGEERFRNLADTAPVNKRAEGGSRWYQSRVTLPMIACYCDAIPACRSPKKYAEPKLWGWRGSKRGCWIPDEIPPGGRSPVPCGNGIGEGGTPP
jgi:PAS domain S-box-containing protein